MPKKGLSTGVIVLLILGAAVVLCGGGCGTLLVLGSSATTTTQAAAPADTSSTTAPSPTTVVEAVTADEILAALKAQGLEVPNPRDNTAQNCIDGLRCTRLLTTDVLSIHEWADVEAADEWMAVDVGPSTYVRVGPTTTVRFASGGSTPAYGRAAYEAVLATLEP